jgi:hypothetical protein
MEHWNLNYGVRVVGGRVSVKYDETVVSLTVYETSSPGSINATAF